MQRRLGVTSHPIQDRLIALNLRTRRQFAPVELLKGGLPHDVACHLNGLGPLATVLRSGQVVKQHFGLLERIAGPDAHPAPAVGEHGADVELVAVAGRGHGTVVADCDRQEVEHEVRPTNVLVTAQEATRLEVVRGTRTTPEQPLQANPRAAPHGQVRRHGHRLGACILHVGLQVVLEVLAHTG